MLSDGCVAGVVRKMLIKHLATSKYCVVETTITEDQLLDADEVFVTNSIYNIRWVQRIGDANFTGGLTRKIFDEFMPTIS